MDHRACEWEKIWITQDEEWEHLRRVYLQARAEAQRSPYAPTYTAQDIKRIIHATNIAKGYGADQVSAGFLRYLPDEAYEEIAALFRAMDALILPPLQMMQTIIALIGKPDGGERPIGLLSFLYRVYMKLHRLEVEQWEQDSPAPWDQAVKGNSALRTALKALLRDEFHQLDDEYTLNVFLDIRKFYDHIDWRRLFIRGSQYGFPPFILVMSLPIHLAPRYLRIGGLYSRPIQPIRGVVAGDSQANSLAKAILYHIFVRAQGPSPPQHPPSTPSVPADGDATPPYDPDAPRLPFIPPEDLEAHLMQVQPPHALPTDEGEEADHGKSDHDHDEDRLPS